MKRIVLYILSCCFIPLSATGDKTKQVNLQYSAEDFAFSNEGNGIIHITSKVYSFSYGYDSNSPALPILRVGYLIGGNEKYENVAMRSDEELILNNVTIAPNPTVIETSTFTDYKTAPMAIDYKEMIYPCHEIEFTGTHQMGGYKYITFLISPFRYDASAKKLYLKTNITLSVQTSDSCEKGLSSKTTPAIAYDGNCLLNNLKNLVVNYDQMEELYDNTEVLYNNRSGSPVNYKCLIITRDSLKSIFQDLADWKTTRGCRSKVLTVEEIDSQYTGSSNQVKIKKALKDYYDGTHSGLQYVLLGGDNRIVPARNCYIKKISIYYHNGVSDTIIKTDRTPTDLYYGCFDNHFEWNANGNNEYGEICDSVDLSPEIIVTRVPIRKGYQAIAYVNRIINYEKNPKINGYGNKILMGGHKYDSWPNDGMISDSEMNADSLYNLYIQPYWSGSRTKLFNTKEGASSNIFTDANLQGKLEQGYTFVDITTHGGTNNWQTRYTNQNYQCDSAQNLKNLGSTIITTIACDTNAFDEEECLSEAFIRNANSGILGYLGCSRSGWGYSYPDILGLSFDYNGEFYKKLFTVSNGKFGEAVASAKQIFIPSCSTYYAADRWIMFGLNPIGDPESPVYLDVPRRFENLGISLSNGTLNVNTDESGCTICVSSPNDSGNTYYEVQNGTTAVFFSVLDGYTLCITKPGFIPFVASCSSTAYIQNETITGNYNVVSGYVYAGRDVTTSQPQGDVVIQSGNVEIYGKNGVTIKNNFAVQEGATLKIVTGN
jgi:hypothetical protein